MFEGTAQVTLTVPLKLLRAAAEIVVFPGWPGDGMLMLAAYVKLKSGVPPEMVMGTATEVEVV
jgi:hypothetical protein